VLVALTGRSITDDAVPAWINALGWLNPSWAFTYATRSVVPEYEAVTRRPPASAVGFEDWVGAPILAAWTVLPLVVGYLRFRSADL
jgi:ABC-2 type transport system permease protein